MYNMLNTRIQSLLEAVRGFDRREGIPIPFLPPPFSSLNRLDIDRNRQFLCMDYHANVFSFFSLFRLRLAQINSRNCTYQYLRINSEQRIDQGTWINKMNVYIQPSNSKQNKDNLHINLYEIVLNTINLISRSFN